MFQSANEAAQYQTARSRMDLLSNQLHCQRAPLSASSGWSTSSTPGIACASSLTECSRPRLLRSKLCALLQVTVSQKRPQQHACLKHFELNCNGVVTSFCAQHLKNFVTPAKRTRTRLAPHCQWGGIFFRGQLIALMKFPKRCAICKCCESQSVAQFSSVVETYLTQNADDDLCGLDLLTLFAEVQDLALALLVHDPRLLPACILESLRHSHLNIVLCLRFLLHCGFVFVRE